MRKFCLILVAAIAAAALGACASMEKDARHRQASSLFAYLYPGKEQMPPPAGEMVAEIKPPLRVGVAFVPDNNDPQFRLPEGERLKLAESVRDAFSGEQWVGESVPIASAYLEPGGGFANLDRVASLLRLDWIALISYDQVQNAGATESSILYWTGIGAYLVSGDKYDILTSVETSVIDVRSRRLLIRASGVSRIDGTATMVGFSELARQARTTGFAEAIKAMSAQLRGEVRGFVERAPGDPGVRVVVPPTGGVRPALRAR